MSTGDNVDVLYENGSYILSWDRVFDILPHLQITYVLYVGTHDGWTDVIHARGLQDQHVMIEPEPDMHSLSVVIMATYNTGAETRFTQTVQLDN
jgi:hypothetical protein